MKRTFLAILLLVIAGNVYAAPSSTFSATAPTQYEDGTMIPASDVLGYTLWCSAEVGGPYLSFYDVPNLISGTVVDISTCVQGIPGSYYFVATANSSTHGTTSDNSNERFVLYTSEMLGKNPLAPTLLTIQ